MSSCGFCNSVRIVVICAICGSLTGFVANHFSIGVNLEMMATFFGAAIPLLVHNKRKYHHTHSIS